MHILNEVFDFRLLLVLVVVLQEEPLSDTGSHPKSKKSSKNLKRSSFGVAGDSIEEGEGGTGLGTISLGATRAVIFPRFFRGLPIGYALLCS